MSLSADSAGAAGSGPIDRALAALDARRSVPITQLEAPGPDDATLLRLLRSAVRVPDHGKRVPFRFVPLRGEARLPFSERLARRSRERSPEAGEAAIEKDRLRFSYAPVIVTVVARLGPDEKIPEQERLLSAGCVCFALLQAAQALGFGAQWLTGWAAYDPGIQRHLGLREGEQVLGFIHVGTAAEAAPERQRPDPDALLSEWSP